MEFLLYLCREIVFAMRKNKKNIVHVIWLLALFIVAAVVVSAMQRSAETKEQQIVEKTGVAYELPRLVTNRSEQIIEHLGYTVSYNADWLLPNWVAYELTNAEVSGDQERTNHFKPDPLVNGDPVVTSDYSNSGYDRGHMAPAGDMKWSEQAMRESFYMTNMCPQVHSLNAGDWKDLEELVRGLAQRYGNIYIACGPIVSEPYKTIGQIRKIAVPQSFYKVLLRQKQDEWTAIGFVMPNQAGNKHLMTYMLTVDEVEQMTGIDFFYNLPDEVEKQVESTFVVGDWTVSR